jgi:hypothetical protein
MIAASDAASQPISQELLKNLTYRNIGPTRQGGRFVDYAVPKQQPYTFYAATASGGLWKTVNSGITFESIFDHEKVFSIGDVTVAIRILSGSVQVRPTTREALIGEMVFINPLTPERPGKIWGLKNPII